MTFKIKVNLEAAKYAIKNLTNTELSEFLNLQGKEDGLCYMLTNVLIGNTFTNEVKDQIVYVIKEYLINNLDCLEKMFSCIDTWVQIKSKYQTWDDAPFFDWLYIVFNDRLSRKDAIEISIEECATDLFTLKPRLKLDNVKCQIEEFKKWLKPKKS